jgi:hypothetical protein
MMLGAAELADADVFLLDAEYTQGWRVFWSETPESRATRRTLGVDRASRCRKRQGIPPDKRRAQKQPHSVRAFLSGTVGKKMGLTLTSNKVEDGVRRYSVK